MAYDSTIAAFKTIMENQKTEIASLNEQLAALQTENTSLRQDKAQLTTEKTQLTEEKSTLTAERNTVFYVIGTKGELLKKKVIEQTGGALGIGKSQVPARDLNAADFTAIDKTQVSEIAFPKTRPGLPGDQPAGCLRARNRAGQERAHPVAASRSPTPTSSGPPRSS